MTHEISTDAAVDTKVVESKIVTGAVAMNQTLSLIDVIIVNQTGKEVDLGHLPTAQEGDIVMRVIHVAVINIMTVGEQPLVTVGAEVALLETGSVTLPKSKNRGVKLNVDVKERGKEMKIVATH